MIIISKTGIKCVMTHSVWFNMAYRSVYKDTCFAIAVLVAYIKTFIGYKMKKQLHEELPREQDGRDSFERYRAQVRSASIAALTILEGTEIDRIYCDLHDDFVKRRVGGGYEFYQVKTKSKQNHNWTLGEVFGIKTRSKNQCNESIKNSFVGKLLLHTVIFDENCNSIVFQTNINNDDNIESVIKDIRSGDFSNKYTNILVDKFNDCISHDGTCYSQDEIKDKLSKLNFDNDVQYLKTKNNNFDETIRSNIYKYSEVDLSHSDTQEIIIKLLDLVSKKSSGKISEFTLEKIESESGISIDDLLSVLSISKEAYQQLRDGGDSKAIKNVSIIQRSLESSGADEEIINYCSQCKTNWDEWFRNARHNILGLDLIKITSRVKKLLEDNQKSNGGYINLNELGSPIKNLLVELKKDEISYDLDGDLILGAVFSEIVKVKS